jgi:hypothetical protein
MAPAGRRVGTGRGPVTRARTRRKPSPPTVARVRRKVLLTGGCRLIAWLAVALVILQFDDASVTMSFALAGVQRSWRRRLMQGLGDIARAFALRPMHEER